MIKAALALVAAVAVVLPSVTLAADYTVITRTVTVARTADAVWNRVGDFCAGVSAFLKVPCTYTTGAGDVGTVRKLSGGTEEVMVARTSHSYAYQQTAGSLTALDYHGGLDVEPSADGKTSTVIYTVIYDASSLTAEQKPKTQATLTRVFQGAVEAIKALSEAS